MRLVINIIEVQKMPGKIIYIHINLAPGHCLWKQFAGRPSEVVSSWDSNAGMTSAIALNLCGGPGRTDRHHCCCQTVPNLGVFLFPGE